MSKIKTRRTGQISAKDEQGQEYQVIEYTEFHDASTFGNPDNWVEGLKEYRLNDGSHVNKTSETEFEIVKSGVKLRVSS
jgi:hypothetical protein